jgi:membrane protein
MFLHRAAQVISERTWPRNLRRLSLKLIAQRTWASMLRADVTGRSAQLAYYFFFSLFPGLVAASALLGMVAASGQEFSDRLVDYLATVIPPSAFAIVLTTFDQTTHASSGRKVLLGLLAALWAASAGTSAIQDALNSVHRIEDDRPYWKARLQAIGLTIAIVIIFAAALSVLMGGDVLAGYLSRIIRIPLFFTIFSRMLTWPIAFAIVSVAFALVYYVAPDIHDAKWRWITPGSMIGSLLWLLASSGLRVYLHFFNSYSVTYGSLGAVIVLLTWFYLGGLALLMGAQINVVIEGLAAEHAGPPSASREAVKTVAPRDA